MVNALRRRGLEEFITRPLMDLLPNEADYNTRDAKEIGELAKDKTEVTEKHRKAYATVRAIIKPNSACEAIISEADFDCDVQLFFKLFENQYLKTISISAAFNLVLLFNKPVDDSGDVIQAYIKHREIIYQMEQVKMDAALPDVVSRFTPAGGGTVRNFPLRYARKIALLRHQEEARHPMLRS